MSITIKYIWMEHGTVIEILPYSRNCNPPGSSSVHCTRSKILFNNIFSSLFMYMQKKMCILYRMLSTWDENPANSLTLLAIYAWGMKISVLPMCKFKINLKDTSVCECEPKRGYSFKKNCISEPHTADVFVYRVTTLRGVFAGKLVLARNCCWTANWGAFTALHNFLYRHVTFLSEAASSLFSHNLNLHSSRTGKSFPPRG